MHPKLRRFILALGFIIALIIVLFIIPWAILQFTGMVYVAIYGILGFALFITCRNEIRSYIIKIEDEDD